MVRRRGGIKVEIKKERLGYTLVIHCTLQQRVITDNLLYFLSPFALTTTNPSIHPTIMLKEPEA